MKKFIPFIIIICLILIIKNNIFSIISSLNNKNTAHNLENRLSTEKKKNQYLKERLSYVKTNDFVEEEAQNKLGMLKSGEYFIIAPTPAPIVATKQTIDDRPNWQRWLELLY